MQQQLNEIEINGVKYVRVDLAPKMATGPKGPIVLVRANAAGVHFGELADRNDATVTLRNARRVWKWTGANTCSELSQRGPSGGNIAEPVPEIVIAGWCEIIPMSDLAVAAFAKIGWAK